MSPPSLRELWAELESRFDGEIAGDELRVRSHGVELTIAEHESYGAAATRISGDARGALGLRLRVMVGRGDVGRGLGARDVRTGDPAIDEHFVIKANDSRYAEVWLDEEVSAALARSAGYRYVVQGERVTAALGERETSSDRLAAALNTASALASRGRRLAEEWADLASDLGYPLVEQPRSWRPDGSAAIIKQQSIPVTIDGFFGPVRPQHTARLYTRVSAPRMGKLRDHFAITIDEGVMHSDAEHRRRLTTRMAGPLRPLLRDAAPSAVVADPNFIRIYFHGFQTGTKRLLVAIRCAEALAEEPSQASMPGPYR